MTGALLSVAVAAPAALACSPVSYEWSGSPRPVERNVARTMVERATSVHLITAEQGRPFDIARLQLGEPTTPESRRYLEEERDVMRSWSQTMTFRVQETLKGEPVGQLEMGVFRDGASVEDRRSEARGRGRFSDPSSYWSFDERPLDADFRIGGCLEPLRAVEGASYLIFLDDAGKLLDARLEFRRGNWSGTRRGPAFVEVFGDGDPWLSAVRREAARTRPVA